jgi:hypothetical protein
MSGMPSGGSSPPTTPTSRELKRSTSWATDATSAYRVGMNDPPQRSVWATGHSVRSCAHTP